MVGPDGDAVSVQRDHPSREVFEISLHHLHHVSWLEGWGCCIVRPWANWGGGEGGREGGEGGREGQRKREGRREGGREGKREGGKEEGKEGRTENEGGRKEGSEGGRMEREREGDR